MFYTNGLNEFNYRSKKFSFESLTELIKQRKNIEES